ncbi:UvrD-helicase domain-containing protein, partial [Frankia torreyi]
MVGSRCEAVGPAWCAVGVVAAPAPAAPAGHRLVPTPVAPPRPFVADAAQRRVIEHPGGPLLVLAGPGTGKTATLVEAVAARIEAG